MAIYRFLIPCAAFVFFGVSAMDGANATDIKECSDLSSIIFVSDTEIDETVELAEKCKDEALGHSYLQSALIGLYRNQEEHVIEDLAVPDSEKSAESYFKAFSIRKSFIQGALTASDKGRKTYSYLFESVKRGSLYGSAYVTYMGLFRDKKWAGNYVENLKPLGTGHLSAVNQLLNHLNRTCFYSTVFPSKNPAAPEPLVLEHYWQAPEFAQMLVLLRENDCEHVENFISTHAVEPKLISEFFVTEMSHAWELENVDELSIFKLREAANQYAKSTLPEAVEDWVQRYKSFERDSPLNWCDENHPDKLNLCYRFAFFDDFYCKSALSVEGYVDQLTRSAEYNYCRSMDFASMLEISNDD